MCTFKMLHTLWKNFEEKYFAWSASRSTGGPYLKTHSLTNTFAITATDTLFSGTVFVSFVKRSDMTSRY